MGRACARHLANTHTLILTDVSAARLATTAETVREEDNAEFAAELCGDIADDGLIGQIAAAAADGCQVLVRTAGLSSATAGWAPIIRANLVGTAQLLDAVEPLLTPGFIGVLVASTARSFVLPTPDALASQLAHPLTDEPLQRIAPHLGEDDESLAANAYAYYKA